MKKILKFCILIAVCIVASMTFASCNATVEETLTVDASAAETTVYKGYDFDFSKLSIVYRRGKEEKTLKHTDVVFSGFDQNKAGEQVVTCTYGAVSDTFTVKVIDANTVTFYDGDFKEVQIVLAGQKAKFVQRADSNIKLFDGWYDGDVKFDFDTVVTRKTDLTAKYITVAQYRETQKESFLNIYEEMYQNDKTKNYLKSDWEKVEKVYADTLAELEKCSTIPAIDNKKAEFIEKMNGFTVLAKLFELKEKVKTDGLSDEVKANVQDRFDAAEEQIRSFDGGAPSPEYVLYNLKKALRAYGIEILD